MTALLDALFAGAGAAAWGAADYGAVAAHMSSQRREQADKLCPNAATVLAAAFPYYGGAAPGNLSLYARGADYHAVLGRKLKTICDILAEKYPAYSFIPGVDSSPLPEREAAWLAGVGLRGRNGLVILPPYGSYVFLGTILTDKDFALPAARPAPGCPDCGACLDACPTGALTAAGVDVSRCLSDLTQRKGAVTPGEAARLAAHPLIWGCDLCQTACPYNAHPLPALLPEFREGLVTELTEADLEGLTNRTFQEKYGGRAFSWRGPGPLRRNLKLKNG